jgi:hypothetical protein
MKTIYLLIYLVVFSLSVYGQNYIPFEMSVGTYWRNSSYNCCSNAGAIACIAEHYSEVLNDTLMAGKTYYKVRKSYISNNGSANCMSSNYSITHYLREDTLLKCVYERIGLNQDTIIMDFSQQIGDTCNLFNFNYANSFTVSSIDSVLINGIYHKRINYGGGQFSLIEGVGCTLGITELWYDFENYTTLTCKGKNGFTQYPDTTSNFNSCIPVLNLGLQSKMQDEVIVSVFPNPSATSISCSIQGKIISHIKLFDPLGKLILLQDFNTHIAVLDINPIANGIYRMLIIDDKGKVFHKQIFKE